MKIEAQLDCQVTLSVLSFSPVATAIYHTDDLLIQTANAAMLALWSKDDNVIGTPLEYAVKTLHSGSQLKLIKKAWETGLLTRMASGKIYHEFQPVKDQKGAIYCILHTAIDMSRQHAGSEDERPVNKFSLNLETDRQRENLKRLLMEAPASICILRGPELIFEMVNTAYQQLFPGRRLLGRPLLEALPEIKGQPIIDNLQSTLRTGDSYIGKELYVPYSRSDGGPVQDGYFNIIYLPRRNESGEIDGLLLFIFDVTELVLSKLRAEESESNLQNLIRTSRYGLMILRGPDYIIETANQPLIGIWGETVSNVIGKRLDDVFPDMKDQVFPALLKMVYDTGISYVTEQQLVYYNTPSGKMTKYIRFSYDPIFDLHKNVCGLIVSAEEITEKVENGLLLEKIRVQEQLIKENLLSVERLERENRFRDLVQQAPVAMVILKGRDMVVELANEMVLKIWMRTSEICDKPLREVLPELVGQPFLKLLDDVYTSGTTHFGNEVKAVLFQEGENREIYFNYIYKPLKDEHGKTTSVMVVATDVTSQVKAKRELERAEEILRFSVEAANVGTWLIKISTKAVIISTRQKNLFGFNADDEVTVEALVNQISEEYREKVALAMEKVMTEGGMYDQECPVKGFHNGKIRWLKSVGSVIPDDTGKFTIFSGVTIEITEQKEDEMRKNNFINIVSHELKTPLTSLKGYMQLLLQTAERGGDAFMSRTLSKADSKLDKMTRLINGFLNVSLLESGKIKLMMQEFDLEELIKEVVEDANMNSPGTHIPFKICQKINILADRDKIGQVVANLISNAVKYSPAGSEIHIDCQVSGKTVEVKVKDNGKGISADDQTHVFDRYYRVENSENKLISGFGIGLYLCWEIIQSHHGTIAVKSEPGKGSEFCFTLPAIGNSIN